MIKGPKVRSFECKDFIYLETFKTRGYRSDISTAKFLVVCVLSKVCKIPMHFLYRVIGQKSQRVFLHGKCESTLDLVLPKIVKIVCFETNCSIRSQSSLLFLVPQHSFTSWLTQRLTSQRCLFAVNIVVPQKIG